MQQVKQRKSCDQKCMKCQNRDKKTNFCKIKDKDCISIDIEFSNCDSFLIDEKLLMF